VTPTRSDPAAHRGAEPALPPEALLVFAPLHKAAFGVAIGTACGLSIFLATAVGLLLGHPGEVGLYLLSQYFFGYEESWRGALIGLAWGFGAGGVAGWFIAFTRNFTIAAWLFVTRTRAHLASTRGFLDHI
jgi:hypothetical protein